MARLRALVLAAALLSASALGAAAKSDPAGTFTVSGGVEGGTVTFTPSPVAWVNNNYETTIGVWCFLPSGGQIIWSPTGNNAGHNPYIYEFNTFGGWPADTVLTLVLPIFGTGYDCTAREIAAYWKPNVRSYPIAAWILDTHTFTVVP